LRLYLGRRFVLDFARIVKPLNDLLRKGVKWVWRKDHQQAFGEVKARLSTDPMLACPDFGKTFILKTDACAYGIGAIESQKNGKRRKGCLLHQSNLKWGRKLFDNGE